MSNPRLWRAKVRTTKPNSRQKRNGLFLDVHPDCQICGGRPASEAHHDLPKGHPRRYARAHMQALCSPCHVDLHRSASCVQIIILILI
jgi:5-methylcytosine-specific restriction endonuclease McrA